MGHVVALLSTAVRSLKDSPGPSSLVLTIIGSLCIVIVGLLALRAGLGQVRLWRGVFW